MNVDEQYEAWRAEKRSVRVPDGFEEAVMRRVSAEAAPRRVSRWEALAKVAAVAAAAVLGLMRVAIVLQSLLLPA